MWSYKSLSSITHNFDALTLEQQEQFLAYMNRYFPPEKYELHKSLREKAIDSMKNAKSVLQGVKQEFPPYISINNVDSSPNSLQGNGIVFTCGGEGERLRLSLLKKGILEDQLTDFTKATFPLKDFYKDFGTLHCNLALIHHFEKISNIDIPVIITTGPADSITARVIPQILKKYDNFQLKHILIVEQDERLHLTVDNKIAFRIVDSQVLPITQPDESGGPLVKLSDSTSANTMSALTWLEKFGCKNIIVVQGTALYDPKLIPSMASALGNHDALAVGILRSNFPKDDAFGAQLLYEKDGKKMLFIAEQEVRTEQTRTLQDKNGFFLPLNTGFYAFKNDFLKSTKLPNYATPPKEVLPELPRSPKIGYAATDYAPFAKDPIILTIEKSMYGVIKTADDIENLSVLGKNFGLEKFCQAF